MNLAFLQSNQVQLLAKVKKKKKIRIYHTNIEL